MDELVEAICIRRSDDENTVAIVSCTKNDKINDVRQLYKAIYKAVTKWVATTNEGLEAFEANGDNLNVGDLEHCFNDEKLTQILSKFGVENLNVVTYSQESNIGWDFDDQILDANKIPE